jgi:LmbE family N-acetylglucosaminyl deacetylase
MSERTGLRLGQSLRRKKLASQGRAVVALRMVSGEADGVTRKWRIGTAEVRPGELVFTSTVGGALFLKRSPVTLSITGVDTAKVRSSTLREALRLNEMSTVIPATSPDGRLELAVEDQLAEWVISRLSGESEQPGT